MTIILSNLNRFFKKFTERFRGKFAVNSFCWLGKALLVIHPPAPLKLRPYGAIQICLLFIIIIYCGARPSVMDQLEELRTVKSKEESKPARRDSVFSRISSYRLKLVRPTAVYSQTFSPTAVYIRSAVQTARE